MDKLGNQLANVSLYDVKKYVRQAQNAVLNFSDMESKVREATNNEPWGASTSVMQQIAQGTYNHQQFHEVMPFIYRRFTEKTASEWRQIYKALQLLEFLIKNGAERVVDYARSHMAVIDMLRNFHYVDSKNRDQGINIRNRAGELLDLLNNVEKIRQERKRAKQLNQKTGIASAVSSESPRDSRYSSRSTTGLSGEAGLSSSSMPQFGSGAYSQRVYGDGGFNGSFAEQRIDDDDDFAEYEVGASAHTPAPHPPASAAPAAVIAEEEDEFDDFQSAPSATSAPANTNSSILDLFGSTPAAAPVPAPSSSFSQPTQFSSFSGSSTSTATATAAAAAPVPAPAPAKDAFGSLWETSKSAAPQPKPQASQAASTATTKSNSSQMSSSKPAPAEVDDLLMF